MAVGVLAEQFYSKKGYGFPEVREWIRKNTLRGFLYAVAVFLLLFLLYKGIQMFAAASADRAKKIPVVRVKLSNLPPPPSMAEEAAPPPPPTDVKKVVVAAGPAARAGTPVPVPDALISPDLKEFATMEEVGRATPEGGEGEDQGGFMPTGDGEGVQIEVPEEEEEPGMYEFIPVEKQPYIDLAELKKKVKYPEVARRAGLEGRVVVRVLVGKDGKPRKCVIEQSDNEIFNQAAIDAIMQSVFTPAIQNGEPIAVWVSIPIDFKLK